MTITSISKTKKEAPRSRGKTNKIKKSNTTLKKSVSKKTKSTIVKKAKTKPKPRKIEKVLIFGSNNPFKYL